MTGTSERRRPSSTEYDRFYSGYVDKVPDGDIIDILKEQLASSLDLLALVPEEKMDHSYAPGKWTLKEVLGHIIDTEWVFTYRALRFARGDKTPLPGMDQDDFMAGANFKECSFPSLLDEFRHLRTASRILFDSFGEAILDREGIASGCTFTVRSIPYIIAGHERHHVGVLTARYL
jgi:hypothetical protein